MYRLDLMSSAEDSNSTYKCSRQLNKSQLDIEETENVIFVNILQYKLYNYTIRIYSNDILIGFVIANRGVQKNLIQIKQHHKFSIPCTAGTRENVNPSTWSSR